MSRIGRMPIPVPPGVNVKIHGERVVVKGPKGEIERNFPAGIEISFDDGTLSVHRASDEREHRALHGMARALLNNMVVGVSTVLKRCWK